MIVGVGFDVAEVARIERALQRSPALRDRLFAPEEQHLSGSSLAGRFAAKEAVAKALGAPPGLAWTDAVVTNGQHGRPILRTYRSVAARVAQLGITDLHLSISHDGGLATAMVVAERRCACEAATNSSTETSTTEAQ